MTTPGTLPTLAPEVGDPAPQVAVINLDGQSVDLATRWEHAPRGLAVVFLRHYGCPYCRLHAQDFQRHAADFATAGIDVALIGCGHWTRPEHSRATSISPCRSTTMRSARRTPLLAWGRHP